MKWTVLLQKILKNDWSEAANPKSSGKSLNNYRSGTRMRLFDEKCYDEYDNDDNDDAKENESLSDVIVAVWLQSGAEAVDDDYIDDRVNDDTVIWRCTFDCW